jgi:hypothetical protein
LTNTYIYIVTVEEEIAPNSGVLCICIEKNMGHGPKVKGTAP